MDTTVTDTGQRSKNATWTLSERSFERFLDWLDNGSSTDGQAYLEMRRRLVTYFDRKNCLEPDELADETLNRVARRLEEEGSIESDTPAKFCYTVARYVFLESLRSNRSKEVSIDEDIRPIVDDSRPQTNAADEKEQMLQCLEKCCNTLELASRELIVRYYHGKEREKIENRRRMAENLGISMNALSIRACRIRDRLEICVRKCSCREE
jgi:DNA-directed RNA polymerase specialized sigma24 family protein